MEISRGIFLIFFFFNQLNYSLPKNSGQVTAYSSRRLLYNWMGEISRWFPWNLFPFPILITDGLVSVTGIIIIRLSSRFLNNDGNCIQKLLFHTLFIHSVCLFTLHAWVAILSLKIHDNTITRILQAHTHVHLFTLASISLYRAITTSASWCPAAFHTPSRPAQAPARPREGAGSLQQRQFPLHLQKKTEKNLLPPSVKAGWVGEAQLWGPSKHFSWRPWCLVGTT